MTVRRKPPLTTPQRHALERLTVDIPLPPYYRRCIASLIGRGLVTREMKDSQRGVYVITDEGHDLLARMKVAREASQ